ncbi:type I restriction endonuclease subunit R [Arthrobacter psychrochitiniphilus]|uniref:Restriction endonuclease subunit R n=1 Tax=Arthrobacter psychrochitiniphilus TaxID=291045 RepID=A0A2V3DMX0_9MICC|nr:type I restriction endonuclease [Arthrobacter psychrochitiniphilus]NYG16053.1 type I restriction enzyme R subunit [Arthrobacter psychrochitiniphilus]PXA64001.1 restriction endonuclease subunit R [Arthrobacter psychrochitiniphilus]
MADYNEHQFEKEICEHLAANGWLYSVDDSGYDRDRALFPEDAIGWLQDTQPDKVDKVVTESGNTQKQTDMLLDAIVKALDLPLGSGGGTLNVLRSGARVIGAGNLVLFQLMPETTANPKLVAWYSKMRLRVMRQVHFSPDRRDNRSLDLVLFVNGIPIATLELKTDFTQSIDNAIEQYKTRLSKDANGRVQPLLGFGTRALVHFAVSNSEVWMTTKLAGPKTRFLPFNMGYDGGKGNPPATYVEGKAVTSASSYLWEMVLERDSWLNVVGKMMVLTTNQTRDPITGQVIRSKDLIFPRFHQWDVVRKLTDAVVNDGVGHKYLIEHSAGSGKTNSIAWAAHRFARLHSEDKKVFDSVIVVVDRAVLDAQLQAAIRNIDPRSDIVVTVNEEDMRQAGATSKSELLAQALTSGKLIIVVTIQTFPFAMQAIRTNKGLKGKTFAVLADEAHSSQSGQIATKLRAVLTSEEIREVEEGGEIDIESVLAAETAERADSKNLSYFAFTATPKPKTLELFGTPVIDGPPKAFHRYTMKQAIEEGYILDVLRGYQTYDSAFKIARNINGKDEEVNQSVATKELMRWVKLHPTNITRKVEIIVEHFRENVACLLDGHSKAMVVTDSRKAAVKYKKAMDEYITKMGYDDPTKNVAHLAIGTLVAFSGSVQMDDDDAWQPSWGTNVVPFTEASMNPGTYNLSEAFKKDDYRVMLVANKFQTGFDQPLLCAMYVDKVLSGVTAVQTLSRLNRTYTAPSGERKNKTFVLDFVNGTDIIKAAFEPYYKGAYLESETDPYLVVNLATKLAQAGIYTEKDVERTTQVWVKRGGNNALMAALSQSKHNFQTRYESAITLGDKSARDELDMFRKDVGTYVRIYDFMSQVINYGDPYMEMLSIFLRLLERLISEHAWSAEIDLSDINLVRIRHDGNQPIDIGLKGDGGLKGAARAGSAPVKDPKLVAMSTVLERLNELFGADSFTTAERQSFVETLVAKLLENQVLAQQARVNSKKAFAGSPEFGDAVTSAVADNQLAHNKMADYFFMDSPVLNEIFNSLAALFYERATAEVA